MRLSFICFTKNGANLCRRISQNINTEKYSCVYASTMNYESFVGYESFFHIKNLKAYTEAAFSNADALIFVGACGIAVRSIAPFIRDKTTDPAVVVLDEMAKFSIALLSGHIGGANELAKMLADLLHASPVITTATDLHKLLAIDSFAVKRGLYISDMQAAKHVSAGFLFGDTVGFHCLFPFHNLPPELAIAKKGDLGVCISIYENEPLFTKTLLLVPRILYLGIGCKKDSTMEAIEDLLFSVLSQKGISQQSIKGVATISLKAKEAGLLAFCEKYNWPLICYSASELESIEGNFTSSAFVLEKTGVDNVCERAAMSAAAYGASLLQTKTAKNGVTLALAAEKWSVDFAE